MSLEKVIIQLIKLKNKLKSQQKILMKLVKIPKTLILLVLVLDLDLLDPEIIKGLLMEKVEKNQVIKVQENHLVKQMIKENLGSQELTEMRKKLILFRDNQTMYLKNQELVMKNLKKKQTNLVEEVAKSNLRENMYLL